MKQIVEKADRGARGKLSKVSEQYSDIFPGKKTPYAPPSRRLIDHEIDVLPASAPPHKIPYTFSNVEMEELRTQVEMLLERC